MNQLYWNNLVKEFIPKGATIFNVEGINNKYRSPNEMDLLIYYFYELKEYLMILSKNEKRWNVEDVIEGHYSEEVGSSNSKKSTNFKELVGGREEDVHWGKVYEFVGEKPRVTSEQKSNLKGYDTSDIGSNKSKAGYVGSKVGSGLGTILDNQNIVLGCVEGNLDGLNNSSSICIISELYQMENELAQELYLTVEEIGGTFKTRVRLDVDYGYSPNIGLYDFSGSGAMDILISMRSGGSGGYYFYYIYTLDNGQLKKIFDWQEFIDKNKFKVTYMDNKKVMVVGGQLDGEFIIDISLKEKAYLDSIYNADGTLKDPITGSVSGVVNLYPVSINNNRKFELHVICNIIGIVNQDILGGVVFIENWAVDKFVPIGERVILFGNTTYDNYGLSKLNPDYVCTPYEDTVGNKK